jgi:hypothetical protein
VLYILDLDPDWRIFCNGDNLSNGMKTVNGAQLTFFSQFLTTAYPTNNSNRPLRNCAITPTATRKTHGAYIIILF